MFYSHAKCLGDLDRKLRHSGTESKHKVAKSGSSSGYPSAGPEDHEVVEETRTRCPCGSNVETGTMIQVFLHFFLRFCLF